MGGSIAIILREPDGTTHQMIRWTNSMRANFMNKEFLAGEPAAIHSAIEQWLLMKADWEKNNGKGPFQYPMTAAYTPYSAPFQPDGYGFVVVDFVTKTLLSSQGYSHFSTLTGSPRQIPKPGTNPDDIDERWLSVKSLFEGGAVTGFLTTKDYAAKKGFTTVPHLCRADFVAVAFPDHLVTPEDKFRFAADHGHDGVQNGPNHPYNWADLSVSPPGWTFQDLSERLNPTEVEDVLARLETMGFVITDDEKSNWRAFYKNEDDE